MQISMKSCRLIYVLYTHYYSSLLKYICVCVLPYAAPKEVGKQMVKVKLQLDSQLNMDDPAMQQFLLQQVSQSLRGNLTCALMEQNVVEISRFALFYTIYALDDKKKQLHLMQLWSLSQRKTLQCKPRTQFCFDTV